MSAANPLYDALIRPNLTSDKVFLRLRGRADMTFAETFAKAHQIAHALRAVGVAPGDRVAIQAQKSPEALCAYLGCAALGAVYLPLNTAYTPSEVAYFVGDAEPKAVICDPARESATREIAGAATVLTLDAGGGGTLTELAAEQSTELAPTPRGADDLAAILYTSGTTGRSKGAMLSQNNLLSNAEALAGFWRFTADDVLLHALPIFHTHGLFVATNILLSVGGAMIFLPKFDIDAVIEELPNATSMMGVPTFYTRLLDDPRFGAELASGMRLFVSGSAPLLAQTHVDFEARSGHRILERYGMTETNMITTNPYDGERRPGAVGFPLPEVSVRVTEPETGAALGVGEIGMIEVTGPNVFQGYWRMPEKTASEFRSDGFFITGDLGKFDEDGYLYIVGRDKDLIISGGFNVYPKEIETVIDEIDGVLESAVFGAPHPDFGEGVAAAIVTLPGREVSEATVMAAVGEKLAKFKQPKKLFFVDELPRNTMGKVQKATLRKTYGEVFAA